MFVSYNKLWHLMLDKNINKTDLRRMAGISSNVVAKLGRNESVTTDTLAKICSALQCDIGDIIEMANTKKGD